MVGQGPNDGSEHGKRYEIYNIYSHILIHYNHIMFALFMKNVKTECTNHPAQYDEKNKLNF